MLAVQDRGWGLASDDRLHVFEPFFRSADGAAGDSPALALVSPSFSASPTSSAARSPSRASLDKAAASCFVSRSLKPRYRRSIGSKVCRSAYGLDAATEQQRLHNLSEPDCFAMDLVKDTFVFVSRPMAAAPRLDLTEKCGQRRPQLVGCLAGESFLSLSYS